jgi:hypothetical protein
LPKGLFLFIFPAILSWGIISTYTDQRVHDCCFGFYFWQSRSV